VVGLPPVCKEWNIPAFQYRHINMNHPENGHRQTKKTMERGTTILEAGAEDSSNQRSDDNDRIILS
jgi:hypothetical protein